MTETTASQGFFITDYEQDARAEIIQSVSEVTADIHLPTQRDEWGCVAATGAFITNQLCGENTTTPRILDEATGRRPDTPGNASLLMLEFLKRGLSIDAHVPYTPLAIPGKKLAYGEIDFDTYFAIYQEHLGVVPEENHQMFRNYYNDTLIPSILAAEARFAGYKHTGQMVEHDNSDITERLLETLVRDNKHVFASELMSSSSCHTIAIFRPDNSLPALSFIPGIEHSAIVALSKYRFEKLSANTVGAVALCNY